MLLSLLTVCLFTTALFLPLSYTPENTLAKTARKLQGNLQAKEHLVQEIFSDPAKFNKLKQLGVNSDYSLNVINDLTINERIWLFTYKKGRLASWTGVKTIPRSINSVKKGYSFIRQSNGYYEAIRKDSGDFTAIAMIPVSFQYGLQNKYIINGIDKGLIDANDNIIQLADFTDKEFHPVHSVSGAYLFSVRLKPDVLNTRFFYSELTLWILAFLVLCTLVYDLCQQLAKKGYPILATACLLGFIVLMRFVNLQYHWPDFTRKVDIFDPKHYHEGWLVPSLGDFCINVICLCWLAFFVYLNRNRILTNVKSRIASYAVLLGCAIIFIGAITMVLNLFHGLVVNSSINFDVTNVLNLSHLSVIGLFTLCISFLAFYFLNDSFIAICARLPISNAHKAFVFLVIIIAATTLFSHYQNFTSFYLCMAMLVFLRAYSFRYNSAKLNGTSFMLFVLISALISSIQLNHFEQVREHVHRRELLGQLLKPNNAKVNAALHRIEQRLTTDKTVTSLFTNSSDNNALKNRLEKFYFDGYLTRYNIEVYRFNAQDEPVNPDSTYSLSIFKDLVLYSSLKVSRYFYRENESFGFQNYFALIPITTGGKHSGTMVIELRSRNVRVSRAFPELLAESSDSREQDAKDYSYAFYTDGKLINQNGSYVYDLTNKTFDTKVGEYKYVNTESSYTQWYRRFSTYSHLIYRPSKRHLIVVSQSQNILFYGITSLTFFFVMLLLFAMLIVLIRWLWLRMRILTISDNRIKWGIRFNFDKLLYKTRIQLSMILAVVVTLVLVGFITFLFISTQYNTQQEEMIRDKITRITTAFEAGQFNRYLNNIQNENYQNFEELANTYNADLTLYDTVGQLTVTTQPKIYAYHLLEPRMNARAYIQMDRMQKSELISEEAIGELRYKSVYAPLNDASGKTVAYLQLPYFSNEADYKERVGSLLNAMINVYALIFITIGLFAVVIARQITAPLNFIQNSLSRIIYGKKNEPIKWERDDEIGALIKEYNKMIAALENSAQKLAQSERESAWREMAKQVAHEIKNPLTPLKLGLQLLDKAWKDKDPRFDQKFERFSKSFVEQIESLSSIASEFSAFAKMPDTKMENLNIFEVLNQAVIIFKQMDNLQIIYNQPEHPFIINADRDQLLRCFNNLLKNAIEATPADKSGIIEINYLITSKNILLSIKDNGAGIPEHMREKIFEPNFTTKSSGTGLGLAFIKNSIENAGGKVWFETEIGVGTTFYLSLPAADNRS